MKGRIFTKEKFAERLSASMKDHGDTVYTLADYLHLSPSAISKYANANMVPKDIVIDVIAQKYNLNPAWLMGADGVEKYVLGEEETKYKEIPILGTIAAGHPIYIDENVIGYESVSEKSKANFCLKIKGDSMINARIFDGDIVFIREQPEVENGEIAAVIIDGEEATLKRFYKYGTRIVLRSENPKYPEFEFTQQAKKQVQILGKCIAVKFWLE